MKKRLFGFIIFTAFLLSGKAASIGTWKTYMAYHDITWVEKGGHTLFVLASDNLYSYNLNDESIQTYDKINALSDCDINKIAWNNNVKRLIIVYKNQNIDLMDEKGEVENISDYYSKSMTEDKTINDIYISDNYAYLSTGFGIIKVNMAAAEISDTYNLGFNINYCYIENDKIYAASNTNGLYSASLTDNLLDKSVWIRIGSYVAQTKTMDAEALAIAKTLEPGGPKYNYFGILKFHNGKLYTACGNNTLKPRPGIIQILDNDEWTIFGEDVKSKVGLLYQNLYCMDIDPNNENHIVVGCQSGLYEYKNKEFTINYNNYNSLLETASTVGNNDKNYVMTTGIKFDDSSNLWLLNSIAPKESLIEFSKEGEWISHAKSELMQYSDCSLENMTRMIIDSRKLIWFTNDFYRTPSLFYYEPSTDALRSYKSFINQDGTTVSAAAIRCVTEDNNYNMWVGTNIGPLLLTANEIANDGETFEQVKVPRNDGTNLADYLLAGTDIKCIAVDGGNRKWFGTGSDGVYLISDDNLEQLQHFTTTNSKLLSNNIEDIAINHKTGEVFFGTDKGLCSYMSDATAISEEMTDDNVYAYPNPVRPEYRGLITITGLTYNADVKIVTTNGILVAQGRSNGGTFTWDGNDLKGKRVASGIYMVETATEDGNKGTVCKIAIVN